MPAPLREPQVKVTHRINEADMDLLRAVWGPGQVNAGLRALVEAYCGKLRERMARPAPGASAQASSEA